MKQTCNPAPKIDPSLYMEHREKGELVSNGMIQEYQLGLKLRNRYIIEKQLISKSYLIN